MSRPKTLPFVEPVTCIIPCRNAETTIERAIDSACRSGVNRVYVYDDGSTDQSFEIISRLYECERYCPILEIWSIADFRAGVVFARNFLIEQADFGLIIPLDADDTLRPITDIKLEWEENTFIYGNYVIHEGNTEQEITAPPAGTLNRKNIANATIMFHKADWEKVKGYDVDFAFAEDYGLMCAFVNAGIRPKHVNRVIFDRYLHATGNERTAYATAYWDFYRNMARQKYPGAFVGSG